MVHEFLVYISVFGFAYIQNAQGVRLSARTPCVVLPNEKWFVKKRVFRSLKINGIHPKNIANHPNLDLKGKKVKNLKRNRLGETEAKVAAAIVRRGAVAIGNAAELRAEVPRTATKHAVGAGRSAGRIGLAFNHGHTKKNFMRFAVGLYQGYKPVF